VLFNLVDKPWITVVTQDLKIETVSLVELFERWEDLRSIQGDNPPTTLALYRFILAILHRAYDGPRNADHWEEIFEDNGKGVVTYLNQWRDRFDLFHAEHPFMQDTALSLEDASINSRLLRMTPRLLIIANERMVLPALLCKYKNQ
jgi:CRISPR system Cascade subunit CasA